MQKGKKKEGFCRREKEATRIKKELTREVKKGKEGKSELGPEGGRKPIAKTTRLCEPMELKCANEAFRSPCMPNAPKAQPTEGGFSN